MGFSDHQKNSWRNFEIWKLRNFENPSGSSSMTTNYYHINLRDLYIDIFYVTVYSSIQLIKFSFPNFPICENWDIKWNLNCNLKISFVSMTLNYLGMYSLWEALITFVDTYNYVYSNLNIRELDTHIGIDTLINRYRYRYPT